MYRDMSSLARGLVSDGRLGPLDAEAWPRIRS